MHPSHPLAEPNADFERVIVGDVPKRSAIVLAGSLVAAAGLAAIFHAEDGGLAFWLTDGDNWLIVFGALLLVSGGSSYLNDGLIVSLISPAIILFGFFIAGVGSGFPWTPTLLERIGAAIEAAMYYSVFIGSIGYVLGRLARRMTARFEK